MLLLLGIYTLSLLPTKKGKVLEGLDLFYCLDWKGMPNYEKKI